MSKKTFTLMRASQRERRHLLRGAVAAAGSAFLAGCDRLSQNESFLATLQGAEHLNRAAHKVVAPQRALAQEFGPDKVAQAFRGNGTLNPRDADYQALREGGFAGYKLAVGGLVARPVELTLEELRALPSRTQITRHDCVEGWSCIGKWKGARLAPILAMVEPKPEAKFVLFRCFDSMSGPTPDGRDSRYYESIDLDEARHEQTILAYELNDRPLPITNGAPLRCRVERQLGYKQAKYIRSIELVESFAAVRGGNGGYWEDQGYEWYAGI
jgi:DMSO/TMAO reductase YedYZ molybdopterin-dependent catalytic subunit